MIRYQAHGSPANVLDLYAAADIPETEGYGKPGSADGELKEEVAMMYASSAAHVSGKRLASSELSVESRALAAKIFRAPLETFAGVPWPKILGADLRKFLIQTLQRHMEKKLVTATMLGKLDA